jgi:uncharacterized Tic20 family protein
MAISMEGPRITRALPRVEAGTGYVRAASIARANMALSNVGLVTLFDDRVDTPDGAFPLTEGFGARLCPDPRAPLTVDPPMGLGLMGVGGKWMTYMPRHEVDAVHMLAAIEQAYAARGLTLERYDVPQLPAVTTGEPVADRNWLAEPAWRLADPHTPPPVWRPLVAEEPLIEVVHEPPLQGAEAVLLALTHLSLLFAPVLLSTLVWFSLRASSPRVSAQAKDALRFQAVFYACALPILGAAVAFGASRTHAVLALLGLVLFLALLLVGAGVAFWAAVRAYAGQTFNYNPLPNPYAITR